jgi:uncharacterized cupin superfamily protein
MLMAAMSLQRYLASFEKLRMRTVFVARLEDGAALFRRKKGRRMSNPLRRPALDPESLPMREGSSYPPAYRDAVQGRRWRTLGDAAGLSQFGVNLVELAPGSWSSQRHWHTHEDELIYVLEGELVLITDDGEQRLVAGAAAGFPAGKENGHHLINRSDKPARLLAIGSRSRSDSCQYPDIDLIERQDATGYYYTHKDGTRY